MCRVCRVAVLDQYTKRQSTNRVERVCVFQDVWISNETQQIQSSVHVLLVSPVGGLLGCIRASRICEMAVRLWFYMDSSYQKNTQEDRETQNCWHSGSLDSAPTKTAIASGWSQRRPVGCLPFGHFHSRATQSRPGERFSSRAIPAGRTTATETATPCASKAEYRAARQHRTRQSAHAVCGQGVVTVD